VFSIMIIFSDNLMCISMKGPRETRADVISDADGMRKSNSTATKMHSALQLVILKILSLEFGHFGRPKSFPGRVRFFVSIRGSLNHGWDS
jgi:hypothetical protein